MGVLLRAFLVAQKSRRIHCAATEEPEPDADYQKELDEIDINNFINILAEVTMAVAARRLAKNKDVA